MKRFARWLYMRCYRQELLAVKRYCYGAVDGAFPAAKIVGAVDTLETLELLVGQ